MKLRPLFLSLSALLLLSLPVIFIACAGGTSQDIESLAQQAYVKASNTEEYDQFGQSVAVSGNTLAVGAIGEDSDATGVNGNQADNTVESAGAVYVYIRDSGGSWTQQAYIKASNTEIGDGFGFCVALSGDTLAVGAPYEDSSSTGVNNDDTNNAAPGSGAVYVFTRDAGGTWSQQAYIKASNTDVNDEFGTSVALYGDTLSVGAPVEGSTATGVNGNQTINTAGLAGAVYVFTRTAGTWTQQAYIKASNTESGDEFGTSVALFGDTLAVGAPFEDSSSTGVNGDGTNNLAVYSGAVYVFTRTAGTWSHQAYVKASNTELDDNFGTSVALSSNTLVVGAPFENSAATGVNGNQADNSAINAGAAYVFTRDGGGTWSQQAYIKASYVDGGDQFGYSTALSDDHLAVGAWVEDGNATGINGSELDRTGTGSGAVNLFTRDGCGTWSQQAYVKASNTDSGDRFGYSLDMDSETLAVGATWEASAATGVNGDEADNTALIAGAVYVFY